MQEDGADDGDALTVSQLAFHSVCRTNGAMEAVEAAWFPSTRLSPVPRPPSVDSLTYSEDSV